MSVKKKKDWLWRHWPRYRDMLKNAEDEFIEELYWRVCNDTLAMEMRDIEPLDLTQEENNDTIEDKKEQEQENKTKTRDTLIDLGG